MQRFAKIVYQFVSSAPFLCLLKTSENLTVFWCFQGVEKGCIGNEWVKGVLNTPLSINKFWSKNLQFLPKSMNFNPFVPNAPFFYPLKTSENRRFFWCFQEVEKGCIGNEWVKRIKIVFKVEGIFIKKRNLDPFMFCSNASQVVTWNLKLLYLLFLLA